VLGDRGGVRVGGLHVGHGRGEGRECAAEREVIAGELAAEDRQRVQRGVGRELVDAGEGDDALDRGRIAQIGRGPG
jgi:hypothetical protein